MHYRVLSVIITICAFVVLPANAQSYRLYSTRDGLCSTQVNHLLEDHYGMIWMATEDGLSRFDGVKFINYQHNKDDVRSLSHDYVTSMFEDKDGHMIVSTHAGIQMYCPETDDFSALAKSKDGKTDLPTASSFLQRKNGELWILCDKVYKLTISGQSLVGEPIDLPFPPGAGSELLEDQQGNIWLLKSTQGIWKLDIQGRVTHYLDDPSMPDFSVICEDRGGRIYVGTTNSGVYSYDSKQNDFSQIKDPAIQNDELCAFLMQDDTYLLLGTGSNGVKVYNTKTNEVYAFQRGDGLVDYSLMKVHALLKDHSGNLWVSVYKKGVMMFPSQTNFFNYIGQHSFSGNLIGSCTVTSIMRDHEGILWVGTDNDGIYALNDHTQKAHISPMQGAAPTTFSLLEDSNNNIWFGSYTKGMGKLDRKTLQCTYRTDIKDANGRQVLHVYDIKEDKEKRLWIATLGSGLYCLDLNTNTISFNKEVNEKLSSWLYCVLPTSDNKLLVGSHRGLFSIDLKTFAVDKIIDKQIINCLHEDNQGRIWVGTSSGVVCWNPANNKFDYYTTSEGLADNTVNAILHDERGNIWFTTNRGIGLLNPAQKTIVNYYANDGLQVVEFSQNAFCQVSSGVLCFGGVDGLVYFRPEEITNPGKKWTVRINDLYLYGSRIHGGTLSGGKEIISGPVYLAEEFRLSHSDNSFSIEFATQEYNAPERLDFLYAFDDDKWQRVPHGEHLLSFSNLSPGTYKLRIKAVDNGVESNVKEVSIVIVPFMWESWWAYCLYVLLGILVCGVIWYERVQRRKANQKIAEQLREDQQKEQRLQFLINMAHEIRTPMTLVISPLRELMGTDKSEEHQRQYKTMFRNSERILSLINQLMDVRKIDEGQMSLSFREQLVDSVARPLYELFQLQAERRRIDLQYINNVPDLKLWLDISHFDKIIANLLSNAMKFTPDGGTIRLMIRETIDNHALIEVSDSGKGITSDDMEHIFERFYQTKNYETTSNLGTGIGLHLAYELVRLHHGKIWVENHADAAGCSFFVEIPKGTAHLNPDEIVQVGQSANSKNSEDTMILAAQSEEAEVLKGRVGNKPRLLIVEDDEEIRAYLSNELSKDFLVSLAVNGKEGLEEAFRRMPDIIVSDIMMPEMDGVTLCKKIRQNVNLNHIPIILLTAKTRLEDAVASLDAGADDYVTKPFQLALLKKKLQTLLLSRERLRNAFQGNQLQEKKYKKVEMKSPDERLMDRIMKVINENLDNPDLTVEMITREVGISRVHLHRKLKELTNQTTRDFVRNVRLKQAAILLSEKRCSVAEVAEKVGYPNTSNFSTAFKEVYGVSPKTYMEQSERENLE